MVPTLSIMPRPTAAPLLASAQQMAAFKRSLWPSMLDRINGADRGSVLLSKLAYFEDLNDLSQIEELLTRFPEEPQEATHIQSILRVHDHLEKEQDAHLSLYDKKRIPADKPSETVAFPFMRRPTAHFFGGTVPIVGSPSTRVADALWLYDADGRRVGQAFITAGGTENSWEASRLSDGGLVSAVTIQNLRNHQQDGFYYAFASLPNRPPVRILALTDGAGGYDDSEVASSAFLQGVHAGVQDMLLSGSVPLATKLFEMGSHIMADTMQGRKVKHAVTTASVISILGAQATVATAGDSMVTLSARAAGGAYRTVGISEQDIHVEARQTSTLMLHASGIPRAYFVPELKAGDRFVIGSDGLWDNILQHGTRYKYCGTDLVKQGIVSAPDQIIFNNLNQLNAHTAGQLSSAATFLKMARRAQEWNTYIPMADGHYHFPAIFDTDNTTALIYEHGTEDSPREWSKLADEMGPLWDVA